MTRNRTWRMGVAVGCAVFSAAVLLTATGCQSGGLGGLMGSKSAMDMLSPLVKDAANSYVANLTSLTNSLSTIRDVQGAVDFAAKARPMVDQLSSSYQTLSGTTGQERASLMEAFGPKLNSANSGFLTQTDRVKSGGMWGSMLSPVLDQVKLFK